MTLPNYKFLNINSEDQGMITAQLNQLYYGECPIVLNILPLDDKQEEALSYIEEYLSGKQVYSLPYPVYIISSTKHYYGHLNIVSHQDLLPNFFDFKSRQLNNKEELIYNRIQLKLKNIRNILPKTYLPILKKYTNDHKEIYELYHEQKFWDDVLSEIEGIHGK